MFVGQGAAFSRRNRFVLAFLLNIICLSVFILSNLYEGFITSFMIEPAHEYILKSVDEFVASNYEIMTGEAFEFGLKNSSFLEKIKPRLNTSGTSMGADNGKHVIEQRFVFIRTCDVARISLAAKLKNGKFVSDYYYLLEEELTWQFIELDASYSNPFITRLQYYLDLSFQAGLPHMWKVFVSQGYSHVLNIETRNDKDYLEIVDLIPVFVILFIGCGLSAFLLVLEIFFKDFIENLNIRSCCCSCWNFLKTRIDRKAVRKPKVRWIIVRPRIHN